MAAVRRVAKGNQIVVASPVFVDADETPTDCDSTPTVAVARLDGTVLAAPTVTDPTPSDGRYAATLTDTDHTDLLDVLTLTWTGAVAGAARTRVQQVEVVGAHHVEIAELREEPNLDSAAKYPTDQLRDLRDDWADRAEDYCEVAFAPRYALETHRGAGNNRLVLDWPRPIALRSVTIDGQAQSLPEFTIDATGTVVWDYSEFPDDVPVVIGYEHGHPAPPPQITRGAALWIRAQAVSHRAEVSRDTLSEAVDGRTVRYSTPDPTKGRPTGMMEVDAILNEASEAAPGAA